MSDIKAAYKEIAVAVWQLCTEERSDNSAMLKPTRRVKVKNKKLPEQNPQEAS